MAGQYSWPWDMSYMTKMTLIQDMIVRRGMYKGNFVVASTKEPRAPPMHPYIYLRNPKPIAVPSQLLVGARLSLLPPVQPSVPPAANHGSDAQSWVKSSPLK